MTMEVNQNRASFPVHDKDMRSFRQAHGSVALVNAPKRNEPVSLKNTLPLVVISEMEPGGTRLHDRAVDWSVLVPISRVPHYKLWQN